MLNQLQVFSNREFGEIRTVNIDGEPWLVANDLCNVLGYKNARKAVADHVDPEDVAKCDILSNGGMQTMNIVNESGFYALCFGSKLPTAREFKRWVTNDVLKSIRQHGFYVNPNREIDPDVVIALCTQYKEAKRQIQALNESNQVLKQQVADLTPKATYYDLILNCKDLVAITTIAKDYGMSAKAFNLMLKEYGIQYYLKGQRIWILKREYACYGYTQTKSQAYNGSDGEIHSKQHTYWTQKGRLFLYQFLKNRGIYPIIEREKMVHETASDAI